MQRIILYILFSLTVLQTQGQQQIVQKIYDTGKGVNYVRYKEIQENSLLTITGLQTFTPLNVQTVILRSDLNLLSNWQLEYQTPGKFISIFDAINFSSNCSFLLGVAFTPSFSDENNFVAKIDSNGAVTQSAFINSNGKLIINGMIKSNNQIILYGRLQHVSFTDETMYLAALDSNLQTIWSKEYSFHPLSEITHLVQYTDNGFIAQARTENFNDTVPLDPARNMLLMRLDSVGNLIWASRVGSLPALSPPTSFTFVNPGNLIIDKNGEIINGVTTSWFNWINQDLILQRVDQNGNTLFSKRFYGDILNTNLELIKILTPSDTAFMLLLLGNRFLEIDTTFTTVSYQAKYPSALNVHIKDIQKYSTGGYILGGDIQQQNKILTTLSDSLFNIGCRSTGSVSIQDQTVSFTNLDITNRITVTNVTTYDSTFSLNAIPSNQLTDSLVCLTATYIPENQNSTAIKVFPLITRSVLNIENNTNNQINKFQILNILGATATEATLTANSIDVSMLPNGIYILKLFSNNISHTFKFVKQ